MSASIDTKTKPETERDLDSEFSLPQAVDCIYTSCFCEENVWWLCDHVQKSCPDYLQSCYTVFISNIHKTIPLWQQKASQTEDGAVVWDYHVIFIYKGRQRTDIYDIDSRLSFPCDSVSYVTETIRQDSSLKPQYRRLFRVIPAEVYLATFASDRSHMLTEYGIWLKPPPSYPCIATEESTNNIQEFIEMKEGQGEGTVMKYWEFCQFLKPEALERKRKSQS